MQKEVALISVPDQKGLIHKITGVILDHGLNITETQEFVDHTHSRFFMRLQFEGPVSSPKIKAELKNVLPAEATCQVRTLKPRRLVVLASQEPHCLGDVLLRHSLGELNAEICGVISQHDTCRGLTERFGLPYHHVPTRGLSREQHEDLVRQAIAPYEPDYVILARYMRILTSAFIAHFPHRLINIHHSFLPAFIGKNPYEQAHERGVKIIGATAHFVTEELDQGPIITQGVIPINHAIDPKEMARRGQDVEKIVLIRAVELILEDRVMIDQHRTIVFE